MSTPIVTEPPFTTETNKRGEVLYRIADPTLGEHRPLVALAYPSPEPFNRHAWHVALFDPCGDEHAGAAASEKSARTIAEIFARTAARAVSR